MGGAVMDGRQDYFPTTTPASLLSPSLPSLPPFPSLPFLPPTYLPLIPPPLPLLPTCLHAPSSLPCITLLVTFLPSDSQASAAPSQQRLAFSLPFCTSQLSAPTAVLSSVLGRLDSWMGGPEAGTGTYKHRLPHAYCLLCLPPMPPSFTMPSLPTCTILCSSLLPAHFCLLPLPTLPFLPPLFCLLLSAYSPLHLTARLSSCLPAFFYHATSSPL